MANQTHTRFDVNQTVRVMIEAAVAHDMVDAIDLLAMGRNGATDQDVAAELIEIAYANSHTNPEGHSAVVRAVDAARAAEVRNA